MPIISLVGQKGGGGKSTTAIALATEWHRRGFRVLLVDADDEQRTALTWADTADELGREGPRVIGMGNALRTQLPPVAAEYQITIIDTPGRNGRRTTFALGLSDFAVLPCAPTAPELWAMAGSLDQVRDVQAVRPGLDAAILIAKRQPNTAIGRAARAALEETECPVLAAEIYARVTYAEAVADGRGPTTYAPGSEAAGEVAALVDEIEQRLSIAPAHKPKRRLRRVV